MLDVKAYGAVGDRSKLDSAAFQAAIDECHWNGGGTVNVPVGDYTIGSIEMKSGVLLHLDIGATLWASTHRADYREDWSGVDKSKVLIKATNAESFGITGKGTIRGFGTEKFGSWWGVPQHPELRVCTMLLDDCRSVTLEDICIRDSAFWTVHLKHCDTVHINRISIHNYRYHLNTDGIVPDGCRNVFIKDCHLSTGDDCIPIKSTENRACGPIFVMNCILESPNTAIKFGTEIYGTISDVYISHCTIQSAIGIGIFVKDGGTVERVQMSGITIESADLYDIKPVVPVFMDIEKRHADSKLGSVRDIAFRDLFISTRSSIVVQGAPDSRIDNLSFQQITMRITGYTPFGNRYKPVTGRRTLKEQRDTEFMIKPAYMTIAYGTNLRLDHIQVFDCAEAAEHKRHDICLAYSTSVSYNYTSVEAGGHEQWIG
ncbi:glycosyl hydrolase family 28 protein [Paenibacillus qinlingensis]|uniref:Polygalacturonase n=1 Tax=Paenibacillus qinlingensis TaxID=1837343 RepID=A0ABU1NTQ6_9BACL|nr:glycosyl hydrolase family 28 protein [Paenibacillus qinlingensis]MDR6550820.1 polygalacturonase [Paenibacillus qinlingensis]